jgi:hypothetical protein
VGTAVDLVALVYPLPEDKRICECTPARGDVDRASSSEIEGREVEEPPVGVPGPASNRTVDDGGPTKREYCRWKDTTSFKRSSTGLAWQLLQYIE